MGKVNGYGDHNVDVMISMRNSLLTRLDAHLRLMCEHNRSAWVRQAIVKKMSQDREDISLLEEVE